VKQRPELTTARLRLRPFALSDAPELTPLVSARDIAATTLNIPHPYEEAMAEEWISTHEEKWESGELAVFALVRSDDDQLVGAMGLVIQEKHRRAELGYWVGKPFWGEGFATEAAQAVVAFGFDELNLQKVLACCFRENPASARVLEKIGMKYEGRLRGHVEKWGDFKDLEMYGILRGEYKSPA